MSVAGSQGSGVAARRRTVGHEAAEPPTVSRHEPVECVDSVREPNALERRTQTTRQAQLAEERRTGSSVAAQRRPVAEDEPPALRALVLGNRRKEPVGLAVPEREQREPLASVERGDDPRRPAAEASAAVVEEHGPKHHARSVRLARVAYAVRRDYDRA
jgi:hypothetical protein